MKLLQRRILAALLLALLMLALFPTAALAEPGDEEGSIAPAEERNEADSGEISLVEENEDPREEATLCHVVFSCHPEDAWIQVYDPTQPDEAGESLPIEPEEDGSWLLEPGEYCFRAGRKGYETVEDVPFSAIGESKSIDLSLLPELPASGNETGEEPFYEEAYPLPTMTGDSAVDTANVAVSQLGYTKNSGTVYGAWWNGVTDWGVDYTYADWCAMFACWCADQAGAGMNVSYNKNGANANLLMEWQFANASGDKSFTTKPKVGDFIFFGTANGIAGHVAIVNAYDENNKTVYFVGGNQGNSSCVSRGTVRWGEDSYWGSQLVLGYGRPNYNIVGEAPKAGLDAASGGGGVIQVSGWAVDPDEPETPVTIRLCVGGPLGTVPIIYQFEAKEYREGMEEICPGAGPNHGFSKIIPVDDRGTKTLYFYVCDLSGSHPEILFATAEVTITDPMLIFYTVSYDANGGEGAPAAQVKTHDVPLWLSTVTPSRADETKEITLTLDPKGGEVASTSLTTSAICSFSFESWNTAADGSGTGYAPGASYMPNEGATLFAQWSSETETNAVTLPTPKREGYLFQGWTADPNAVSGATGSYTPAGDETLYAIWKAEPSLLLGDVNRDGIVNLMDLILLRRGLAGEQVELFKPGADLDGDGELSPLDLMRLRRLLVKAE